MSMLKIMNLLAYTHFYAYLIGIVVFIIHNKIKKVIIFLKKI